MKFTKYLVGLAASAGMLLGCQQLEMVQICDPSEVIAPVLADVEDITITAENQKEIATFVDAILNNKPLMMSASEGGKSAAACIAIVESSEKGGVPVKPNYDFLA